MYSTTPKSLRLHIAIFGRTNVGKSSLLNCLTQQDVSIVSSIPGTTTDPVEKPMELLPIGPVLFIDTAGLDDISSLGNLRIQKTIKVFERADIIILVIEPNIWTNYEEFVINTAKKYNTPLFVVLNKIDMIKPKEEILEYLKQKNINFVKTSSIKKSWQTTDIVKSKLIELLPEDFIKPSSLIPDDLIKEEDFVILVIPIDKEAPKGRIILPQQQVIRELLDKKINVLITNEKNLKYSLEKIIQKPKLVVSDSQVFEELLNIIPQDIPFTTFSILFARIKGDLEEYINGVKTIEKIKDNDIILIAESCSHHPIGDDIGRNKIPRWIKQKTAKEIKIESCSGKDFPEDLKKYKLIIQCGGCMTNRKEILSRIYKAKSQNVPITNYGITIAYLKNGLRRSLEIFQ